MIIPICSISTSSSSPEHLQDRVARVCSTCWMLRWQRCVSAHCYLIFCYSHLHKQEGFGGGFDFLLPPEMCPDGCAGDGCLRNQQNLPCLARAEPLVLPEQGRSKAGTNVLAGKWKVFLLCTQQELHMEWQHQEPSIHQPLSRAADAGPNAASQGLTIPGGAFLSPGRGEVGFH